jgi:Glycosyl transferase family 2
LHFISRNWFYRFLANQCKFSASYSKAFTQRSEHILYADIFMDILLSIVIPTYNRAVELDRQLGWLAQEIKGYEQECEVFISDNCSTDQTPESLSLARPYTVPAAPPKTFLGCPTWGYV